MRKKSHRILGLFSNFDEATRAIEDIRDNKVPGVTVDDITIKSPIEHPEVEELLGERPVRVQQYTLFGALFGLIGSFIWISASQATFLVQPQGGKPVITLVSNIILNYEMLILGGVVFTLIGFLVGSGLPGRRGNLYSEQVSIDQVGILMEIDQKHLAPLKEVFNQHKVREIREEAVR